ncbi:MAG: glycosyl hydrolase [Rhodoglobus sp.]|nr:glycosyl hydrolase [Rhodoglobus sp.]
MAAELVHGTTNIVDTDGVFEIVRDRLRRLITEHPSQIPVYTEGGRWHFDSDSWAPVWTGGFLAGMIWAVAQHTNDSWWRDQAEKYTLLLEPHKLDTGTHDLGFLFTPSWGRWHSIDPTRRSRDVLVQAGRTLAGGFNTRGKYLKTGVDGGSTVIDIMMNIDIIYEAADLCEDDELANVATQHALTSRRYLVRGDSSTAHEGWFDAGTGEFLRTATHQGYRADSCWVRGHAWAMYGYGAAYKRARDERFLQTAIECADLYIERTGDALIPPNDWDDPHPEFPYEASAASVAASAMLQLAEILGPEGAVYVSYGSRILAKLCTPEFLTTPGDGWEGLIKRATYHRGNGLGVQESTMWGDYYFVEALERYRRLGSGGVG